MEQFELEKFIVKEFLGETNFAQTDGAKWWFVVYGEEAHQEWIDRIETHIGFELTDVQSVSDEGFVIEFRFRSAPRVIYGSRGEEPPDVRVERIVLERAMPERTFFNAGRHLWYFHYRLEDALADFKAFLGDGSSVEIVDNHAKQVANALNYPEGTRTEYFRFTTPPRIVYGESAKDAEIARLRAAGRALAVWMLADLPYCPYCGNKAGTSHAERCPASVFAEDAE